MKVEKRPTQSAEERGSTLVFVALSLVALLGVMALAIDLGALYVARSEAQRSADAAALAGAYSFLNSGCTSLSGGCVSGGPQEGPAATQAIAAALRNYVAGQPPSVDCPEYTGGASTACPGITFSYPTSEEPQISVTVQQQGIPTIFAKMFGVSTVRVSATSTAEAYSPTGGSTPTQVACVAPFLVPNCNPNDTADGVNSACPPTTSGASSGYFVDPTTNTIDTTAIGQPWALHFGTSSGDSATPSQWYLDNIWSSSSACSGSNSANCLAQAIQECMPVTCGQLVPAVVGKKVGKVDQGVNARIDPTGQGADTIKAEPGMTPPYQIYAGAGNPLVLAGQVSAGAPITMSQSPSVVTVAVYNGAICNGTSITTNCIGQGSPPSCPPGTTAQGCVAVQGWMTLFLEGYTHVGSYDGVQSMILGSTTCGSGGNSVPPLTTPGGSNIPIRLIQHAN